VDFTAGVFAQAVFTLLGAGFLFRVAGGRASLVNNGLLALVFFMVLGMLALLIAQRSRFLSRTVRALQRVMPGSVGSLIGRAEALDAALHALHARRGTLARCVMWRLGATLLYTVETWLAMRALGLSVTWQEALILESLGRAVRSAAFFVPGGLGVQEGGLVLLGNVLGLPAPVLLALSFVKRAREILVGVPALAAWGIVERSSSPAAT
jgi:putative membrane protein